MLLAIDPGLHASGVALFTYDKILQRAFLVQVDKKLTGYAAWLKMSEAIYQIHHGTEIAIEFPQTYGGRAARGDANDLLQLAALVGAVCATGPRAWLYLPSEWKGNLPKDVSMRRTTSKLSEEEKKRIDWPAKSLCHNVGDAIGIGLKHLGR